jgi:hypothetical protein
LLLNLALLHKGYRGVLVYLVHRLSGICRLLNDELHQVTGVFVQIYFHHKPKLYFTNEISILHLVKKYDKIME